MTRSEIETSTTQELRDRLDILDNGDTNESFRNEYERLESEIAQRNITDDRIKQATGNVNPEN